MEAGALLTPCMGVGFWGERSVRHQADIPHWACLGTSPGWYIQPGCAWFSRQDQAAGGVLYVCIGWRHALHVAVAGTAWLVQTACVLWDV